MMQPTKGTKDYPPEEKILRNRIVKTIQYYFELYGFAPLETATLEPIETLTAKYAGGDEIVKEIYKLKDQGKRNLGLRYDLTVPLARFIGENPNIKLPFKRYEIGKVFRDGPIKAGRLREFWQCDGDVIGATSMLAEAELLKLADDVFAKLNMNVVIKVNNRKLLNGIMTAAGITNKEDAILTLDKLAKIGASGVKAELKQKGFDDTQIKELLKLTQATGSNEQILKKLEPLVNDSEGGQGIKELRELLHYLKKMNTEVQLDVSLARGLAYYTGTIYEVYLKEGMTSSIAAGGRWDTMIGKFLDTNRSFPAVGISFGLEPITAVLKSDIKTVTQAYIIPINTVEESIVILQKFRNEGICAEMDLLGRSPSKSLNHADVYGIPFVVFVGEQELEAKKVKLKDLKTGKEFLVALEQAISIVKRN